MARMSVSVDVTGLPEFKALVDRVATYEDALRRVRAESSIVRRRLIKLAFNPDDDAVLYCESIGDAADQALRQYCGPGCPPF